MNQRAVMNMQPDNVDLRTGLNLPTKPMSAATWGWLVALVGWTVLMSFYHLDGGAGFEPVDCWVSQTAREMLDADEWVVPTFANETRMQKSPGPYWSVMATSIVLGEKTPDGRIAVTEVSTRIPNAILAILTVVTTFWLARRIAGDRAAIFAGFASLGSVFILHWSHRGSSDLGVAAFCSMSLAAFWVAFQDETKPGKRHLLILAGWFIAGLGMLYKMPMPLAVVGAPMLGYVVVRNKWKHLFHWSHLVGLVLFAVPLLAWVIPVMANVDTAWDKWVVEFWDRFTGDLPNVEDQKTNIGMYFMYLGVPLLFCLPFSLSLPMAFVRGFQKLENVNRDGQSFMLIWFFALLAFFTAAAGKETRYFLPALPPLFVLLGIELSLLFDPRAIINRGLIKVCVILSWLAVPIGFAAAIKFVLFKYWWPQIGEKNGFEWMEVWMPLAVAAGIFTIGAWLSGYLFLKDRRNASFGALVCTMIATWLWAWPMVMPKMVSQVPFVDIAEQMTAKLDNTMQDELRFIGSQDPRIIWHSNIRTPRIVDQLEMLKAEKELIGGRNLVWEMEYIAKEMLTQLRGEDRVLYISPATDYITFCEATPQTGLLAEGETMPQTHLWLATRLGSPKNIFVIYSNKPRPEGWDEPVLDEKFVNYMKTKIIPKKLKEWKAAKKTLESLIGERAEKAG